MFTFITTVFSWVFQLWKTVQDNKLIETGRKEQTSENLANSSQNEAEALIAANKITIKDIKKPSKTKAKDKWQRD